MSYSHIIGDLWKSYQLLENFPVQHVSSTKLITKIGCCVSYYFYCLFQQNIFKVTNRISIKFINKCTADISVMLQLILRGLSISAITYVFALWMCRKPKFISDSVFKKLNRPKIWQPFRRFSDWNCMQSAIRRKIR